MERTKEFYETEYILKQKGSGEIAREWGVPRYQVSNDLVKFKIPTRNSWEARRPKGSSGKEGYKWCPSCKKDKPHKEFSKSRRTELGLDCYCKSCVCNKSKKYSGNAKIRRCKLKIKLVLDFGNKCKDCRVYNLPIDAFTFHHHSERMKDIGYIAPSEVLSSPNIKQVEKEKEKWILLCANCHNVRHGSGLRAALK